MQIKSFFFVLSSLFLFSCAMEKSPFVYFDDSDERSANLPMAKMRGVNIDFMDERLQSLISEAQSIEYQMAGLLGRLNALRDEITAYDTTHIEMQEVMLDKAVEEPQPILPVPERVNPVQKVEMPKAKPRIKVKKAEPQSKPKTIVSKRPTGQGVVNVRSGVHKDKTRMVFDVNGSTKHNMNFDREAGVVTLTLPDTQWSTATSKTYKLSQVSGYEAKTSGQGTIIAMAVQNASDVKVMALSKPNRLVIDVMR